MTAKLNFNSKEEILSAMALPTSVVQDHVLLAGHVPNELLCLAPHASIFGIADDSARIELFKMCPADALLKLKDDVLQLDDALDAWLAGPEADEVNPSDAYVCYSALRMGVDAI